VTSGAWEVKVPGIAEQKKGETRRIAPVFLAFVRAVRYDEKVVSLRIATPPDHPTFLHKRGKCDISGR
jgi:hypothetical protein